MNNQSGGDLNSAQTFLRKVTDAKTSTARKVKFLREKKIGDDLIRAAFKSIHPEIQIEDIMQFDDAFPEPSLNLTEKSTNVNNDWGVSAVGLFSIFTGALAYLGAYTVRESEITQLRSDHEKALAEARNKIEEHIEKLREERDSDRDQIKSLVKLLGEQSTDVRKTLEILQESLALIQSGVRSQSQIVSPEKTVSHITSLIDKKEDDSAQKVALPEKPSWFNNPIEEPPEMKKEVTTQTEQAEEVQIPSFDFETQLNALQEAFTNFKEDRNLSTFSKSISTIQFYCTKILGDPMNQSFRAISKDNKRYSNYVQHIAGAPDILDALGFTLKNRKLVLYLYEEDSTPYTEQLELVQEAQTLLKKLAEDPEAELFEAAEEQTAEEQFLAQVASTKANASDDLLETPFQSPVQASDEPANHPYSSDFSKVVEFIQSGKTPDDVRDNIDDDAPNPEALPTESALEIPRKPWDMDEVG